MNGNMRNWLHASQNTTPSTTGTDLGTGEGAIARAPRLDGDESGAVGDDFLATEHEARLEKVDKVAR